MPPLALHQLSAWQELAARWASYVDDDHLRCTACDGSILPVGDPKGIRYMITSQMILDATVMHLRARHAEMEPAGL
jgi:hypothetical protein